MRTILLSLFLSQAAAAEPVLTRVVLSSGGVGQFEFEGDVDGAAALKLDVPLDQVDDVLKSLVVDDPAGPSAGVRLPGQQPLAESFSTLPFKPDAFASAEALLASLVGETVRIASIGASGAILAVSAFEVPGAAGQVGVTRHRLTIATQDGIASAVLEDTPDVAFTSEALRGQIAAALAAIASQRVQDRRTLVLTLAPGGVRHVRFGYVVAVPVWKTSYRLTLPAAPAPAPAEPGASRQGAPVQGRSAPVGPGPATSGPAAPGSAALESGTPGSATSGTAAALRSRAPGPAASESAAPGPTDHAPGKRPPTQQGSAKAQPAPAEQAHRASAATQPAAADQPARLQAFAVVENLSGRDWNRVSVTLTSGRPVLFHTPLYQALFSARPEAPVAEAGGLAPRVDEYAAESNPLTPTTKGPRIQSLTRQSPDAQTYRPPPPEMAAPPVPFISPPDLAVAPPAGSPAFSTGAPVEGRIIPAPPPSEVAQSVAQVEFHLATPVTAASGQSMLLPIIDRDVPARRVALFQQAADPVHPLVALQITNDTAGALPPGMVTLFDTHADGQTGYVGDARLPAIEPGEQRLASFALDQAVSVDVQHHSSQVVTGGTIAEGMLTLMQREHLVTTYRVTSPKAAGRILVIEAPKDASFPLVDPHGAGVATTPEVYRVSRELPAGTTQDIDLVFERTLDETHALTGEDAHSALLAASNAGLPEPMRATIRHAADLRHAVSQDQAALSVLGGRRTDTQADQDRVRTNLASVPPDSALHREYLAMMQSDEDALADLRKQVQAAQAKVDTAHQALASYLAGLKM